MCIRDRISDGLLDTVGLGGACQLAHQLQSERNGTAKAVAGGDVFVYDDFLVVDDGTGQLILKTGVCGGVFALQQAEAGKDAGGGADGGDLFPGFGKGNADVYKRQTHGGVIMSMLSQRALPSRHPEQWMADPGCGYTVQTDVQLWMRDRLVEAIDIVPFGYADTLRGQAEAEENEAFE